MQKCAWCWALFDEKASQCPECWHLTTDVKPPVDWRGVIAGILVSVVAIAVSLASYQSAAGGGVYAIFWGAALVGGWKALRSAGLW